MHWKALVHRLCGRSSSPRRNSRRAQFWSVTPAIECLEERVVPAYVTIPQMPTYSTTGVGTVEVETYTDAESHFAVWTQDAVVQYPEEGGYGGYTTGSYLSSGDLVFEIKAEEGDLVGCPVIVTLTFSGRVFWTDDPRGTTYTSTFRTSAGVDSPTEIIDLTGGHLSGELHIGQAYTFSQTGYTKQVKSVVGGFVTVHVHQDGYSEPWKDFNPQGPPNVLQTITTGVVDARLSVRADVESLQREIDATTFADDLDERDLMGPYLENVSLPVEFDPYLTTELSDDEEEYKITSATWEVGGYSGDLQVEDGDIKDLIFDPKSLPPGNHRLKITAFDSQHRPVAVTRKELKLNVIDELDYQLQVKGKDGALIDVDDARFFEGIKAEVTFVGTIKDLPTHYASLSSSKPTPHIYMNGTEASIFRTSPASSQVFKFEFTYDVSTLPVKDDVPVALKIGTVPISYFGDEDEKIIVVKKPTWLNDGEPKFDEDTVEYKWNQARLGLFKVEAPQLPKSKQAWLDKGLSAAQAAKAAHAAKLLAKSGDPKAKSGSNSFVSLDAYLSVTASVNTELDPTYEGTKLFGQASLLGHQIWNKAYTGNGNVKIGGSLDAKTLDPKSFSVSLDHPITVDEFTLLEGGSIKINVLNKIAPAIPDWLASVTLTGSISPTRGTVKVDAAIMLKKEGDSVVLDQNGTYLGLRDSTLTATGSISANAKVGKGYILEGEVTGSLTPVISVTLLAKFRGAITSPPQLAEVNFLVKAQLNYQFKASAKSKILGDLYHYDSAEDGSDEDHLGPWELINLKR